MTIQLLPSSDVTDRSLPAASAAADAAVWRRSCRSAAATAVVAKLR